VRVCPRTWIPVTLSNKRGLVAGLADISVRGIAIHVADEAPADLVFDLGEQVQMQCRLPLYHQTVWSEIQLGAVVRNVTRDARSYRYRIGMLTSPDKETMATIARYVAYRQADIVREMESLSRACDLRT